VPANGVYDFRLRLFEQGGGAASNNIARDDVQVTDGTFTLDLEFGSFAFDGADYEIAIAVRPDGNGPFTSLLPNQPIATTPQAGFAENAGFAAMSGTTLQEAYENDRVLDLGGQSPIRFNLDGASTIEIGRDPTTTGFVRYSGPVGQGRFGFDTFGRYGVVLSSDLGTASLLNSDVDGPALTLNGDSATVEFDTNAAGDASVLLPDGAISPEELLAPAGATGFGGGVVATSTVLQFAFPTELFSETIQVPAAGRVIAIASFEVSIPHVSGTTSAYAFGITTTPNQFDFFQSTDLTLPSALPSGNYRVPVTIHRLLNVSSDGPRTYYVSAQKLSSSSPTASTIQETLTLAYLPTDASAPSPSPLLAPAGEAPSPDTAAEGVSDAAERSRLERRIAELERRLRRLEAAAE